MLSQTFYFATMRKLTVAFASVFDNISIVRFDANNTPVKTIKVPLAYGAKQKWIQRIKQGNSLTSIRNKKIQVGLTLPRMSFEVIDVRYDPNRQTNSRIKRAVADPSNSSHKFYQRSPVPYDVLFNLHIMTKNTDDSFQILEQIFPYFTPEYTVTINEVSSMDLKMNVPIILQAVTMEDSYDGSFMDNRVMVKTLSFIAKSYFFPPVTDGKIIKTIYDNFYTGGDTDTERDAVVTVGVDPKTASEDDVFNEYISLDATPVFDSNGNVIKFITIDGVELLPS